MIEMNVGYLKECIKNLPDDMPVYVACRGMSNYNFTKNRAKHKTDTFAVIYENKILIITDEYSVEEGDKCYV